MGIFTKNFIWPFLLNVFRELFCLFQHILATVQPKIHLNTKFEILPFGWTKCPKTEPFFFKLPIWLLAKNYATLNEVACCGARVNKMKLCGCWPSGFAVYESLKFW